MIKRVYFLIAGSLLLLFIAVFIIKSPLKVDTSSSLLGRNPVIQVHHFIQRDEDSSTAWVAITAERKLIELLEKNNVTVLSSLTPFHTQKGPHFHIKGEVYKKDSIISTKISFLDSTGMRLLRGKITGTYSFYKSIRNVIGETVFYAFGVDIRKDKKEIQGKRPTKSNNAYALYLKAKQKATAEQFDRAIEYLHNAIFYDSTFAMAFWMIAQQYKEKGNLDSAAIWNEKAKQIDQNHPKWAYRDSVDRDQPLKDLLHVSRKLPFRIIEKGISLKQIILSKYGVKALVWVIDPEIFTITMQLQNRNTGNYITDFLSEPDAILALNGGFFEMGANYSLTPSGLIVLKGTMISPVTDFGGSGVFCIKDGKPEILWTKDSVDFTQYSVAFQCGPVIVEPGGKQGIYNNSYRRLNRSAIGVSESNVVLAIVVGKQGVGLSLYEFAEFLRKPPKEGGAGCDAALNLDGGSSTQVCFSYKNTTVSIPGLWAINSAIVVKKKRKSRSEGM